jgi:transporter family-2 protein
MSSEHWAPDPDRPDRRGRRVGRSPLPRRAGVRLPIWAAVVLAVLSGALMATQAKVNGELGRRLNDGFAAAAISFGSGLVILVVVILVTPQGRRGVRTLVSAVKTGRVAWWSLFGGFGGALLVLSQSLASSLIGVAMFTIAVIGGQTVSGLVLDKVGLAPGGSRPFTVRRVTCAVITFAAVATSLSAHAAKSIPVWLLVLPFLAGLAIAWQQAVNGRVSVAAGSVLTSTGVNFVAGSVALFAALAISTIFTPIPTTFPTELWLYSGGVLGIGFIFGLALAVQVTGVLLLGMGTVAGQLTASFLLDLLAPDRGASPDLITAIATLVVFGSMVVAAVPGSGMRPGTATVVG